MGRQRHCLHPGWHREYTVKRHENWPTLLDLFIESRKLESFEFGKHDCCLFAADAVLVMTDIDLAQGYRGTYSDMDGAMKILGERTAGELFTDVAAEHGIDEIPVSFAGRGDVVLVDQKELPALGIVSLSGDDIWAPGEFVLQRFPIVHAMKAWRI